jgi:hypothetical protein
MRRLGRPVPALELSAEERGALENWARRPKTAQATARRFLARIIWRRTRFSTHVRTKPKHRLACPIRK